MRLIPSPSLPHQTVFVGTCVSLFAPHLALRGPDGSLHDAVRGMHSWNSVILGLFMTSLILLQARDHRVATA